VGNVDKLLCKLYELIGGHMEGQIMQMYSTR
jgi:hypothetical protein